MADALIFDVPVELGLELMTVFRPNFTYTEREVFAADILALPTDEGEELHIHLDVMARHLVDFSQPRSAWQPAHAVTLQDACDACLCNGDGVVPRQIPDDADRAEVACAAQMQNHLDDLSWCLVGWVLGNGLFIDQPGFAALLVSSLPAVEA